MPQELSGSLSRNKRKEKDSHPDMSGSCLIEGVEYWISGWVKQGDNGSWLSLAFKPKDAKPESAPAPIFPEKGIPTDLPF